MHIREVFFSNKMGKNVYVYNQSLRQGDTKGISYLGTVVIGTRRMEMPALKFFVIKHKLLVYLPV